MTMTDAEIRAIAKRLANSIYRDARVAATCDVTSLKAAVQAIDTAMETACSTIGVQGGATLLKVALRDYAVAQAGNLTNAQAALALALWAMKEVGLI